MVNLSLDDWLNVKRLSMEFAAVLSLDGTLLRYSENWEEVFNKVELEGLWNLSRFILEEDRPMFHYLVKQVETARPVTQKRVRFVSASMTILSFDIRLSQHNKELVLQALDVTEKDNERISLRTVSRLSSAGSWSHNPLTNHSFWSSECYKIHDINPSEKITEDFFFSLFLPPYQATIRTCIERLYEHHEKYTHYGKIKTPEGNIKWIKTIAEPIIHEGEIILVQGVSADVTKRQNYIEQLKEHERNKSLALKGIKSGLFFHDLISDTVTYGPEFRKMLGLKETEEIKETEYRNFILEEDRVEAYERHLEQVNSDNEYYFNHYRLRHLDQTVQHYEVHAWKEFDEHRKPIKMIGNLINVEERKLAQKALDEKLQQLEAVINNGFAYMLLLDTEGYILQLDKQALSLIRNEFNLDPTKERVLFENVLPKNLFKSFHHNFKKALQGEVVKGEFERAMSSGQTRFVHRVYKPIVNSSGHVESVLVILIDITKNKLAESAKEEAHIAQQQLDQLKISLLSNLSHELLTPINGILGVNQLLKDLLEKEEERDLLEMQKESTLRLQSTLTNLIDLGKLASNERKLDLEDTDINALIDAVIEKYVHLANAKGLALQTDFEPSLSSIRTDKSHLEAALGNLINNAVKFTPEGFVSVSTKDQSPDGIRILIKDSGIGIKDVQSVFQSFTQESQGASRKYEGTGIGLSLTKSFIEMLNGQLRVESTVGVGSSFDIFLPFN